MGCFFSDVACGKSQSKTLPVSLKFLSQMSEKPRFCQVSFVFYQGLIILSGPSHSS